MKELKLLKTGQIVRHKGERKVIKTCFKNRFGIFTIQFLDNSICTDMKEIELDGRKSSLY
jgi:hypothetical protein